MPNHVDTRLAITGDKEQLKTFREKHLLNVERVDYEGNKTGEFEDVFDFNTITPMPEELEGTTSPRRTTSGLAQSIRNGASKESIKEYKKQIKLADECEKKYGYSDWYSFKLAKWGTKCGAYGLEIINEATGSIEIRYQTAWRTATPILCKLSEMYPDLKFKQHALDEGMNFAVTQEFTCGNCYEEHYDGEAMYDFCNEEFGHHYEKCKCGEWFDSSWVEDNHDASMCYECNEAAIEEKEEA